jgi:hypothetical protein
MFEDPKKNQTQQTEEESTEEGTAFGESTKDYQNPDVNQGSDMTEMEEDTDLEDDTDL